MSVNPRTLALSYISYLVSNLNKKNYKSSVAELADLVEKYGFEADRHLFRCLLSHIDLSTDGKQSGGKDFHQVQLLIQEAGTLIIKPYCASVLCYGLENPELKALRSSGLLFQQLSRILRLTRVQEAVFGIGLLKSSDLELRTEANQFLKSKLPDLLHSYTDVDISSGQEGGLNDVAIEVLHLLLSHLLLSPPEQVGVQKEQLTAFVTALRRDFPRERVPVVLSPLLYPADQDIAQDKLLPECAVTGPATVAYLELCDIMEEMGYHATSSHELFRDVVKQVNAESLTPLCVAKCIGLMVRIHSGLLDQLPLQSLNGPSSPLWEKDKPQELPTSASTWNFEVFVDIVRELAPDLNWQEVMENLDHPGFIVKDPEGLSVIMKIYKRATNGLFPVQILYRVWKNIEGQLSWIKFGVTGTADFSFGDYVWHAVKVDSLKTPPDQENKQIMMWMSLELIETLMLLAEAGQYDPVLTLLTFPLKHCPDVLMLAILQVKPRWNTLQSELFSHLLPVFLAGYSSNSNTLGVLQFAWNSPLSASTVRSQMLQGMADWYLKGEPFDQARLIRVLEVAHELKALSLLLNGTRFQFVIDLAVLASRREFLKLDKWMTDRIREHQEPFVTACALYLKQRTSNTDKALQLPSEVTTTMLTVLQACQVPPNSDSVEIIHQLIDEFGPIMPRMRPSHLLLSQQQPQPVKGFDSSLTPGGRVQLAAPGMSGVFSSGQQSLAVGGTNLPTQSVKPLTLPSSTPVSIPPPTVQMGLQGSDSQQLLGTGLTGGLPTGDSFTSGLLAGMKHHSQLQTIQPSRSALPLAQPATSVRQDAIPGMDHVFTKEIEDEANSYFQRIYNCKMPLDAVLETLKMFKNSTNQKEKDVYLCMLRNLFEEYRFFPHYPEKELRITGSLFGGLIEHSLVTYMFLGTALRYVLEALKKPPGTNMHLFGVAALDKFKTRLKEYPQYCQHVAAISHFCDFPPHLIQSVEYGQQSRDPPRPSQPSVAMVTGPLLPVLSRTVAMSTPIQTARSTATKLAGNSTDVTASTTTAPIPAVKDQGPSIANTTNIDTLLMAVESIPGFSIPPEDIQEKVGFVFNNLTQQNLHQKADEIKDLIEGKHWKWLAHYLVLKRVSIEPNYHTTYASFVELHKENSLGSFTLAETYRNIKVLLHTNKGDAGFSDRSLLKNLGHWLGLLTLVRSVPVLQKDVAMKHLLLEAYTKGAQEMLYVVPFVTKVLEACGHKSSVFKPPNPWTMAILGVLVEMHSLPNVKLNLKFEVEVLCKALSVELKDVKTKGLLSNADKVRRFTQLSLPPDGPAAPVVHHPNFYYTDINVTALAGLKDHLQINGDLALFQAHPILKQYVKPSVERSVQELINPVVERSIKIAVTTTEHILKKDFALDPEEGRMRMAAHHMVRHLTAGMAMITCREPLCMSISNNLKQAFSRYLMATPNDSQKQMIEKAADAVAVDNVELACAFVQKTAMEKAVPEMDKRLGEEFDLRKLARTDGRRYCNHKILTYQAERMPEPLRHKVGGVTSQQARVYEEFANCVPGFLPPKQPPTKITQGYPADEVVHILEKCAQELQQDLNATAAPPSNSHVMAMHLLYDTLQQVLLMRGDAASALLLLQKAMEGLLEGMAQQLTDKDLAVRFRDCHLLVLRGLQDPRAYGPVWASKHSTRILLESREEIKFNVEAVDLLIRAQLVNMRELDIHMAQAMENGLNFAAVTFCMRLARLYFIEEKQDCPISQGDLYHVLDTLARLAANARHPPEGLTSLLEVVRIGREQIEVGYGGGDDKLLPTAVAPTTADFDDPPGLHEKVEYLLTEWVRLFHQPISSRDSEKLYAAYLGKLHQHGMLKSDDLISRFFRISTEMCVELCYRNLNLSEHRMNNPGLARAKCYHTMDAYVKLIVVLVKHSGDPTNTVTKINLLNKVLSTVVNVLVQDHEVRRTEFQQLPYHRLMVMLLQELNVPDPIFDSINFQVLQSFSNTFHNLRPARAPGFAFAWLELTSHRTMIGKLLGSSIQQKGWGLYQQLLLDLFRFLAPFLRNAELAKSTQLLYRGTLRLLLVLLHDFPEFLCDYHFSFCDVIPPNCIQMRNLILSAFPRNMRLPDPFTPNLKVDLLTDIAHAPRILTNVSAAIQSGTFKKDLDSYIKTRAPVTFLSELRSHLQTSIESGTRYNVSLMNALVLYVGMQAIAYIHSRSGTPSSSTITHSSHMDIFQNLAVDLDTEGRYLFLNAVANQLRYPNSHTHYFSCVLLYLFAEANSEAIQEQITRVLLERLIVNRPHPWGLLITFIELIRNHTYKFWHHQFVHCAPEIEKLFESVARSCMQQKQTGQSLTREETAEA